MGNGDSAQKMRQCLMTMGTLITTLILQISNL